MSIALNGWHHGEQSIHDRVGTSDIVSSSYLWIENSMPEQHRQFYAKNVCFIPLTTVDEHGLPWASLVTSKDDQSKFMSSPSETQLIINLTLLPGDPISRNLDLFDVCQKGARGQGINQQNILVAGLGIEFHTRRRNKFAGFISHIEKHEDLSRTLFLRVNQAIGYF